MNYSNIDPEELEELFEDVDDFAFDYESDADALASAGAPKVSMRTFSDPIFTILPPGPLVNVEAIAPLSADTPVITPVDKSRSLITTPGET